METQMWSRTRPDDTFVATIAVSPKTLRELSNEDMEKLHSSLKVIRSILIPEEKED